MKRFLKLLRHLRHQPSPKEEAKTRTQASALYGGMGERELQLRMELLFENFISNRNYQLFEPARQLATFSLSEQARFLAAADRLARKNRKLAHYFCLDGIAAMDKITGTEWDEWISAIEHQQDNNGEDAAIAYLKNLDAYLKASKAPPQEIALETIAPVIERLITALGGRRLAVHAHEDTFTDTERVYLPKSCSLFADTDRNFTLYKATAVFLWAQNRFGTWRVDIPRLLYDATDSDKATVLFQALETLRLDACIERELPGIARITRELGRQSMKLPDDKRWRDAAHDLAQTGATAHDSLDWVANLYRAPIPEPTLYQGIFKPVRVMRAMKKRIDAERAALDKELSKLRDKLNVGSARSKLALTINRGKADIYRFKLSHEGEEVETTPEIKRLLGSVMQDFGKVPEDHLRPEKGGKPTELGKPERAPEKDTAMLLPEWDHSIQQYRPDWCRVFLREMEKGGSSFAAETLIRHGSLLKQLRRTFEALRESNAIHRREPDGDNINLDAAIEAAIAIRHGDEPGSGVYIRQKKTSRNIAVMFITDMSGSTSGWVNRTEKEALVLLCESLETLGDRYAIYGFSSRTREHCDIFKIKSFAENYGDDVKRKIDGITPQDYTRMGAAIRFVCTELLNVEARTRIMITLSDGRPDDRDGYRGRYGIEDTRHALLETTFQGIHPYCITIDRRASDYLPYMYGRANYSTVDCIEKLPFQVSDIYRRITT